MFPVSFPLSNPTVFSSFFPRISLKPPFCQSLNHHQWQGCVVHTPAQTLVLWACTCIQSTKTRLILQCNTHFSTTKCAASCMYTYLCSLSLLLSLRIGSPHMRNIMHAKFITKVIRPQGLQSWLSASSCSLSCYGRHRLVIGLTASLKKREGDCVLFHSHSMHD